MSVLDQQVPGRETKARLTRLRRSRWHLHPGVRSGDQLSTGERAADHMRNGMGSWTFVFAFLLVMALWIVVNSVFKVGHPLSSGTAGFDPYPYILLNLILSTMAGLQAAALLIAAKRSDAIASEIAVHTLQNTEADRQLLVENTDLTRAVKTHTDLLAELHSHVTAISEHLGLTAGHYPPAPPAGPSSPHTVPPHTVPPHTL
ncbi:MAG TPA: DUF1003 domain-containing protein [Acidimicrobiales bacterium]|nr:DUF1003 domain-containing protein [Acidimicrobiales bacterium]